MRLTSCSSADGTNPSVTAPSDAGGLAKVGAGISGLPQEMVAAGEVKRASERGSENALLPRPPMRLEQHQRVERESMHNSTGVREHHDLFDRTGLDVNLLVGIPFELVRPG